jgi:hypothetical protein
MCTGGTGGSGATGGAGGQAGGAGGAGGVFCPPVQSVTADREYMPAVNAFDCDLGTEWSAGAISTGKAYIGSITATFTSPQTFSGVQLYAAASIVILDAGNPDATSEHYTIYGSNDGTSWSQLAATSLSVPYSIDSELPPITFPPVTFGYLWIDITGSATSWVSLVEVKLITGN